MTTHPPVQTSSPPASLRLLAFTVVLVLLSTIPLLLAASMLAPQALSWMFSAESAFLPWLVGVAAVVGVLVTPLLTTMGRVGGVLFAVGFFGVLIGRAVTASSGPAFGNGMIDTALMLLIPSGYFILLFGALRAAGWARIGFRVVAVAATTLAIVLFIVPSGPLTDVDMGNRMASHGLINVAAVVGIIAVVIESVRRGSSSARRTEPTEGGPL